VCVPARPVLAAKSETFCYKTADPENRICILDKLQLSLLGSVSSMLKITFYNFCKKHCSLYLNQQKISCPEVVELQYWPDHICQIPIHPSAITDVASMGHELESLIGKAPKDSYGDDKDNLDYALRRIVEIRHATIPCIKHDILIVSHMLVDACRVAWSLKDKTTFCGIKKALDIVVKLEKGRARGIDAKVLKELELYADELVIGLLSPNQQRLRLEAFADEIGSRNFGK
jgi:hypothetical protein